MLGGGSLVSPVQRVQDFLAGVPSAAAALPTSSYRLGVRPAGLHDGLYSDPITAALREALQRFDRQLPGFVSGGQVGGAEGQRARPGGGGQQPHARATFVASLWADLLDMGARQTSAALSIKA